MEMAVGNKVIYPRQGPCLIGRIVNRDVNGSPMNFYHLVVLGDAGELYVPVDKAQAIGMRHLLDKSEIPKLLRRLTMTAAIAGNWRQRTDYNLKLFSSGSAFDLAEVIESLTELSASKTLSLGELRTLDRARVLLIREISEVTGETKTAVELQVDEALKAREVT